MSLLIVIVVSTILYSASVFLVKDDEKVGIGTDTPSEKLEINGNCKADTFKGIGAERYIDRGDPADFDFTLASLITDGDYHDLDLSSIVPEAGANHLVHLRFQIMDNAAGMIFFLREKGNSNPYNSLAAATIVADTYTFFDGFVMLDANRKVEYWASNTTWTGIYILVRGWWEDE